MGVQINAFFYCEAVVMRQAPEIRKHIPALMPVAYVMGPPKTGKSRNIDKNISIISCDPAYLFKKQGFVINMLGHIEQGDNIEHLRPEGNLRGAGLQYTRVGRAMRKAVVRDIKTVYCAKTLKKIRDRPAAAADIKAAQMAAAAGKNIFYHFFYYQVMALPPPMATHNLIPPVLFSIIHGYSGFFYRVIDRAP